MTNSDTHYECAICHTKVNPEKYFPISECFPVMLAERLCFHCAFWKCLLQQEFHKKIVINGVLYDARPYIRRPYNKIAGSNGTEFYIQMLDGPDHFKTNDLFEYGPIPDFLRKDNPDNAVFLSLPSYTKLSHNPFRCHAVGCWDRYRCVRYNLELEKTKGAFNKIPDSYKIGSQNCPSFIDFYELKK